MVKITFHIFFEFKKKCILLDCKFVMYKIVSSRRLSKFELVFELLSIKISDSYTRSKLAIVICSLDYREVKSISEAPKGSLLNASLGMLPGGQDLSIYTFNGNFKKQIKFPSNVCSSQGCRSHPERSV